MILVTYILFCNSAQAKPLTLATWNLKWLDNTVNKGRNPRSVNDYKLLSHYARQLNADIISVQEVEGKKALSKIFDEREYRFVLSKRRSAQRGGFVIRHGISYTRLPDLKAFNTSGRMRHGVSIKIKSNDRTQSLTLLAVHLKSGCFSDNYLRSNRKACKALKQQIPILEQWIDTQAANHQPFMILGDFNRRLNTHDLFWNEIDDGQPNHLELTLHTRGITAECYNRKYPRFIDHIISDSKASNHIIDNSFTQYLYSQSHMRNRNKALSDHCPISTSIDF